MDGRVATLLDPHEGRGDIAGPGGPEAAALAVSFTSGPRGRPGHPRFQDDSHQGSMTLSVPDSGPRPPVSTGSRGGTRETETPPAPDSQSPGHNRVPSVRDRPPDPTRERGGWKWTGERERH